MPLLGRAAQTRHGYREAPTANRHLSERRGLVRLTGPAVNPTANCDPRIGAALRFCPAITPLNRPICGTVPSML